MVTFTLNCIIVDDDEMMHALIGEYCSRVPELKLIALCKNAAEAQEVLEKEAVDIAFLDVNMPPGKSGLELLQEANFSMRVIIITSEEQHAFRALKQLHAVDYLKKPVSFVNFYKALDIILKDFRGPILPPPPEADIFVKVDGKLIRVRMQDIIYVENIADFVRIWVETPKGIDSYMTYNTLMSLEKELCAQYKTFYKVHRSYIINLKKIKEIQDTSVLTENKVSIPIARQRKKGLLSSINRLT